VGRVLARHDGGWALVLEAGRKEKSIAVKLRRDGNVEVGNFFLDNKVAPLTIAGPIQPPSARPGGEFNTLLVISRGGRTLEIYVNGSAVGRPIRLEESMGAVAPGLALWQRGRGDDQELRAEFKCFTVWNLSKSAP
jgi:hypothetical protein